MPAASSSVTNISETVDRDGDRERVERRLAAVDDRLLDVDRLGDRAQDRLGDVEVVGRQLGEALDLLERGALR